MILVFRDKKEAVKRLSRCKKSLSMWSFGEVNLHTAKDEIVIYPDDRETHTLPTYRKKVKHAIVKTMHTEVKSNRFFSLISQLLKGD